MTGCTVHLLSTDTYTYARSYPHPQNTHTHIHTPRFCTGDWDEVTAFRAALNTWPAGVRPVVHWSEARQDPPRANAHSDYVLGPIALHGLEADVDVMIESKAKELALLR